MAKSSLLMRAATSGGGSSRLMMVLRRSFSSAWDTTMNHQLRYTLKGEQTCACVLLCSHTGVTVSFFSAELYCSSERKGSPLGNVSSGDLVAISQTPSCHSSGHRPEDQQKQSWSFWSFKNKWHYQIEYKELMSHFTNWVCEEEKKLKCITGQTWALHCKSHDNRVKPKVPEELLQTWLCFLNWWQPLSQLTKEENKTEYVLVDSTVQYI